MASSKIIFEDEDYKFMVDYKKATGVSIQRFVTDAVKSHREKIEVQNVLKELPYTEEK